MLGHANPSVPLDIYADLFDDDLEAVADSLDRLRRDSLVAPMRPKGSNRRPPERDRGLDIPRIRGFQMVGLTYPHANRMLLVAGPVVAA
jgi:hypothetical protein